MAIEIIPKKIGPKPSSLLNILFYFSSILLILSMLSFFVLFLLQKNSEKMLRDVEEKIAKKGTPEELALEKEILSIQKKIDNFAGLINLHKANSKFLTTLETLTHPKIFFSKVDLQINEGKISLSGTVDNFEILGQQFLILEKENYIKGVSLSKASIGKDRKIEFTFDASFVPEKFKY